MSDVARLRQSIASEYWAMHEGLSGYATVSRHQFIRERQSRLEQYHALLSQMVGVEQATNTLVTISDSIHEAQRKLHKQETRP